MKTFTLRFIILSVVFLGNSYYSYAQDSIGLRTDRPSEYTVVKGDTLWDISARFLEDPWRWKEIWQDNSHIVNPHLIYPGDVIRLAFVDGKPVFTINSRSSGSTDTSSDFPTVKLSPQVRSEPIKAAITEIPLRNINAFLMANRVLDIGKLENAPRIVAGKNERFILGEGDVAYAKGTLDTSVNNYSIYERGKEYIDPDTQEVIGVQAINLGSAQLRSIEQEVSSLIIDKSLQEITTRGNVRVLPSTEKVITSTFFPTPPKQTVTGEILSIESGLSQVGRLDIVSINLGSQQGVEKGSLLGIYQSGVIVRDKLAKKGENNKIQLPDERAGLLMVFETLERMSFAIVLEATVGVRLGDRVANP